MCHSRSNASSLPGPLFLVLLFLRRPLAVPLLCSQGHFNNDQAGDKKTWQQFSCQQAAACASSQGSLRTEPQRLRPTKALPYRAGPPETPLGWLHTTGEVLGPALTWCHHPPRLLCWCCPCSSSPPAPCPPSCRPGEGFGLGSSCGAAFSPHGVLGPTHTLSELYSLVSWLYSKC